MVDRYTRFILTVIALALLVLVVRPWIEPWSVRAQEIQGVRVVGGAAVQVFPVEVKVVR